VEQDAFILGSVVELIEVLLHSAQFWTIFKSLPCTAKLLNLSKRPNITAFVKTKIITIVSAISKANHKLVNLPTSTAQREQFRHQMNAQTSGGPGYMGMGGMSEEEKF